MEEQDNFEDTLNTSSNKTESDLTSEAAGSKKVSPLSCSNRKLNKFHPTTSHKLTESSQHWENLQDERLAANARMLSLEEDNNRLRKEVAHVEKLGVLFVDAEEQKLKLYEENLALRKRLDELTAVLMEKRKSTKRPESYRTRAARSLSPSIETIPTSSQQSTLDEDFQVVMKDTLENGIDALKTNQHHACDDDVIRVASMFLSQATGASCVTAKQESNHQEKMSNGTSRPSKTKLKEIEKEKSTVSDQTRGVASSTVNSTSDNVTATSENKNAQTLTSDKLICSTKQSDNNRTQKSTVNESSILAGADNQVKNRISADCATFEHHRTEQEQIVTENHVEENEPGIPHCEEERFNKEIQHLEDMMHLNSSEDQLSSMNESSSMTFQFTKIAGVFASLAQRVVKSQKQAKKSQAFCDSLIAENKTLRSHLKTCKHQPIDTVLRSTCSVATQTHNDYSNSEADQLVAKLQARVKKLEKQREEILQVNKNWDTQYRKLKDELEKRTAGSPQGGATALGELPGSSKLSPRKTELEKSNSSSRHQATKQIQAFKHEVARLRQTVAEMESERGCLKAENARLNQALEATCSVYERRCSIRHDRNDVPLSPYSKNRDVLSPDSSVIDELQTHVEVLQEQVKIYREDFETERKDRERSQNEKQKVQEALVRSRREIQTLNQQIRTHEASLQREKREKEKAQRQLKASQRGQGREAPATRRRDRYYGDANEPPAYQGHRRIDPGNPNFSPTNPARRRNRQAHHLYEATPDEFWFEGDPAEDEVLPPESPSPEDEGPLY